jgi:hypothetical protein
MQQSSFGRRGPDTSTATVAPRPPLCMSDLNEARDRASAEQRENDRRQTVMLQAEEEIRKRLKDGESARFYETTWRRGSQEAVCGYVNAKNSFGAYIGRAPWVINVTEGSVRIIDKDSPMYAEALYNGFCGG